MFSTLSGFLSNKHRFFMNKGALENREWETPLRIGVRDVFLEGFRNYDRVTVELAPGFNVLAGKNAQGKTNFLEGLFLLATTRLLRGVRDAEAIGDGRQSATVAAELIDVGTRLEVLLERGVRKRVRLNGLSLPRAADLLGRLPCVCVSSFDMAIVRGEPSERRLFLDLELSSLQPAYLRHLTVYKRALEQRNALLRQLREAPVADELFEPWEEQIAEHADPLRRARREYVDRLDAKAREFHGGMGSNESLALRYVARDELSDKNALVEGLRRARREDSFRSGTGIGPHRDDLAIEVEGRDARLFASQGQQRTAILSIKMSTLEIGREAIGAPPLLLLDDIFSDLDEQRRDLLVQIVLERAGQAVLTCAEASRGERLLRGAKVFSVEAGRIEG